MSKTNVHVKKVVSLVVLSVLLGGLISGFCLAGICEDALMLCLPDPRWRGIDWGPVFCGAGYVFCLKYIE